MELIQQSLKRILGEVNLSGPVLPVSLMQIGAVIIRYTTPQ